MEHCSALEQKKKKETPAMSDNVDERGGHRARRSKSVTEGPTLCDSAYVRNLK